MQEAKWAETDSDDSDADSEASIEALDTEEVEHPMDLDPKWRPIQLQTLAKQLRQTESSTDRVAALQKVEQLIRVSGAEVHKTAPELVRCGDAFFKNPFATLFIDVFNRITRH